MSFENNRGGSKPKMMSASRALGLQIEGSGVKFGIYEWSDSLGALSRRVELPQWLDDVRQSLGAQGFKEALAAGSIAPPAAAGSKESWGHIFISPPKDLATGACVGIDAQMVAFMASQGPKAKSIRFHGYAPGYRPAFCWQISWARFEAESFAVEASKGFMPQKMVPISALAPLAMR